MTDCTCKKPVPPAMLTFEQCARGFVLREGGGEHGRFPVIYAFDRIDDLADWLVEKYADKVA